MSIIPSAAASQQPPSGIARVDLPVSALEQQIADIRAHARAACPEPDGAHLDQWHEFLDIDPDLAGRDYQASVDAGHVETLDQWAARVFPESEPPA